MTNPGGGSNRPPGDPGWGRPQDILFGALVPQLAIRRLKGNPSPLLVVRTLFVSFVTALLLIGVVVAFLFTNRPDDSSSSPASWCAAAAVIAVIAVAVGYRLQQTLPCGTPAEVVGAYRSRFFLRMLANNVAALMGFALSFLGESPWPYFTALPIALVGHWLTAPTGAHLAADDRRLAEHGCGTLLTPILFGAVPPDDAPPPAPPPDPAPPLGPYHQS